MWKRILGQNDVIFSSTVQHLEPRPIPPRSGFSQMNALQKNRKKIFPIHRAFWKQTFTANVDEVEPRLSSADHQPMLECIGITLPNHE